MQKTEQEAFWEGQFGNEYTDRNVAEQWVPTNTAFFTKVLASTRNVNSVLEFGCNVGLNLRALNVLLPKAELSGIEINEKAAAELKAWGKAKVYLQSILEFQPDHPRDLVLIKGVLIHINPDKLAEVYDRMVASTRRYVVVAEYYNPTPVAIPYRGHSDRLFKRDFAGEIMERHKGLRLVDYGFVWRRDPNFPQDDLTWFLMEKA